MIAPLLAAVMAAQAAPATTPPPPARPAAHLWTWSLYENPSSVALAHEAPDTDYLGAVLECAPAGGQVKVSFYPDGATKPQDKLTVLLATADPVFGGFVRTGKMTVTSSARSAVIDVPAKDKSKLDRFAKLCGP